MATYSTSKKLLGIYKSVEGRYLAFGPCGATPKRLRVGVVLVKIGRRKSRGHGKKIVVGLHFDK